MFKGGIELLMVNTFCSANSTWSVIIGTHKIFWTGAKNVNKIYLHVHRVSVAYLKNFCSLFVYIINTTKSSHFWSPKENLL